ncbi:metallophosphoesterase [Candidatus Bipolaricaulota bacterium]|nr:metallophosphoesterase [Candidatus Bipolaricaulota bacterium]
MFHRSRVLLVLALVIATGLSLTAEPVRVAVIADVHAHDANSPNEHKVMVNWAERVTAFVDVANDWPADAIVNLGDYVNGRFVMAGPDVDLGEAERIEGILIDAYAVLTAFDGPIHFVVGNHDVYDLSKEQILAVTGAESTYYSYDQGGIHFVILDAQYDKNENDYGHIAWMVQGLIPTVEMEWLQADLAASELPTVVFIHQPLDSDFELMAGGPPVFNHLAVRATLAADDDVIAVFSGHDHDADYSEIDGIHYFTIAAMVDHDDPTPLTWAMVTIDAAARTLVIDGEGIQPDYDLSF